MQVECEPVDHIVVRVSDYRVAEGGWIRMSFKNVAGDAGIANVEVTPSKPEVIGASKAPLIVLTLPSGWLASWLIKPAGFARVSCRRMLLSNCFICSS